MRSSRHLLAALVLLTAGLAGCLGLGDDAGDSSDLDQAGEASPSASANPTDASSDDPAADGDGQPLRFADAEPIRETVWANGTFTASDSCYAGGCPTGEAFREVQLTDAIAENAPTTVRAELTYNEGPTVFAYPVNLYVYSEDATFYSYESEVEQGHATVEATLKAASATVGLFYTWPTGAEPEFDYTLRIDTNSSPTVIPPGVPVALQAEPGQQILAEPAQTPFAGEPQQPPRLLAYGPDDAFGAELEATGDRIETTVPDGVPAGEHVLVAPEENAPVRVFTNASEATMRALDLAYEAGEAQNVEGPQTVEWSFETSTRPLALGVAMESSAPMTAKVEPGSATVDGPGGTVLDTALGCGLCLGTELYYAASTPVGASNLAAGSYDVSYEPTVEAGTSVREIVVTYER